MIKIDLYKNDKDMIIGYKVSGHADSVSEDEYDLICNSVSVLTQAPVIGLEKYLKRKPLYSVDVEKGILDVALNGAPDQLSQVLLMTMLYGLKDLAEQYPKYVRIQEYRR